MCTAGIDYKDYAGILSEYYLHRYSYMETDKTQLFLFLLKERIAPLALFLIFIGSKWGTAFLSAGMLWAGFSLGTTLTLSVVRFGAKGLFLNVAAMFPQYLLYVPVWYLLVIKSDPTDVQKRHRYSMSKSAPVGDALAYFIILMLQVAGILLETWINPGVVQKILKIF